MQMQSEERLRGEKRHGWKEREEVLRGGSGSLRPEDVVDAETRLAVQSQRINPTVAALADSWEEEG